MFPWAFNPQLLVDEVLNFVRILMVVAGAVVALLLLVSLMFASINLGRKRRMIGGSDHHEKISREGSFHYGGNDGDRSWHRARFRN
jgi:hypothetical protein